MILYNNLFIFDVIFNDLQSPQSRDVKVGNFQSSSNYQKFQFSQFQIHFIRFHPTHFDVSEFSGCRPTLTGTLIGNGSYILVQFSILNNPVNRFLGFPGSVYPYRFWTYFNPYYQLDNTTRKEHNFYQNVVAKALDRQIFSNFLTFFYHKSLDGNIL